MSKLIYFCCKPDVQILVVCLFVILVEFLVAFLKVIIVEYIGSMENGKVWPNYQNVQVIKKTFKVFTSQ